AAPESVVALAGLEDGAGLPVRALDGPRHDVLETAEGRLALALGLGRAKALVDPDPAPAPAAWHAVHPCPQSLATAAAIFRLSWRAMADAPKIVVLEGDQTGQELLEQALRVLEHDVI